MVSAGRLRLFMVVKLLSAAAFVGVIRFLPVADTWLGLDLLILVAVAVTANDILFFLGRQR